jgi:hypothetical protein
MMAKVSFDQSRPFPSTGPRFLLTVLLTIAVLAPAVAPEAQRTALAQTGGSYGLTWSTIDAGGYTFSTGGDYTLGGTVGQPDAGLLTGGDFTLGGGFWGGGALPSEEGHEVYLPLVLRGYGSQ